MRVEDKCICQIKSAVFFYLKKTTVAARASFLESIAEVRFDFAVTPSTRRWRMRELRPRPISVGKRKLDAFHASHRQLPAIQSYLISAGMIWKVAR